MFFLPPMPLPGGVGGMAIPGAIAAAAGGGGGIATADDIAASASANKEEVVFTIVNE